MAGQSNDKISLGGVRIDFIIAATLGVISLTAVVFLAFYAGPLDDFQRNIIWTLLASGVAGASVFVPGFIEVEIPRLAKAAGAVAIFVFIFAQSPVGKEVKTKIFPDYSPSSAIENFLKDTDSENYEHAYRSSSPWTRNAYTFEDFMRVFNNERKPLGRPLKRENIGVQAAQNPPGLPEGAYKAYIYRTTFQNKPTTNYIEALTVGAEDNGWVVYTYNTAKEP